MESRSAETCPALVAGREYAAHRDRRSSASAPTDLGRVPDPQLVVIFLEQSFKPLSVHRGFRPDVSRTSKRRVKRPCLTVPMFQPTLGDLSYFSIDRCKLLKPRVKITTDNYHRSAPFFRALVESPPPSLLGPEGADDLIQSVYELAQSFSRKSF